MTHVQPEADQGCGSVQAVETPLQRDHSLVDRILNIACARLPRLFRQPERQFAFTCRAAEGGPEALAGTSLRYSCMVALGAARLEQSAQRAFFDGETASEYCGRLLGEVVSISDIGDLAILAWAAAERRHPDLAVAIRRLVELVDQHTDMDTVAAAWTVSALVAARDQIDVENSLEDARRRVLGCFHPESGIFAYRTGRPTSAWQRGHVACFADQVYPIQALARLHEAMGDQEALDAAARCAEQICGCQGPDGQWWWHYDVRSGEVVEGYPVYSVHQDAMAPMALLALHDAGGPDYSAAIDRGLQWLLHAPEVGRSMIDEERAIIWRKVGRREPRKLVRSAQAAASAIHPKLRVPFVDTWCPPNAIDFECRPYHLGWILYTWAGGNRHDRARAAEA